MEIVAAQQRYSLKEISRKHTYINTHITRSNGQNQMTNCVHSGIFKLESWNAYDKQLRTPKWAQGQQISVLPKLSILYNFQLFNRIPIFMFIGQLVYNSETNEKLNNFECN
jgi:hypothetical protein